MILKKKKEKERERKKRKGKEKKRKEKAGRQADTGIPRSGPCGLLRDAAQLPER